MDRMRRYLQYQNRPDVGVLSVLCICGCGCGCGCRYLTYTYTYTYTYSLYLKVPTYLRTYSVHAYIRTSIHPSIHTFPPPYIHPYIHTYNSHPATTTVYTLTHTLTHTHLIYIRPQIPVFQVGQPCSCTTRSVRRDWIPAAAVRDDGPGWASRTRVNNHHPPPSPSPSPSPSSPPSPLPVAHAFRIQPGFMPFIAPLFHRWELPTRRHGPE
jgi:hypothetical protein